MAVEQGQGHALHRVRIFILLLCLESKPTVCRYVEQTLEHNRTFDAKSLLAEDPSYKGRLKYWTNELCATRPHTFDFVVTVGLAVCFGGTPLTRIVGRRRHRPVRQLALPAHRSARPLFRPGLIGLSDKV